MVKDWPSQVDPGSLSRIQTKIILPGFSQDRTAEDARALVVQSQEKRERVSRPQSLQQGGVSCGDPYVPVGIPTNVVPPGLGSSLGELQSLVVPLTTPGPCLVPAQPSASNSTDPSGSLHAPRRQVNTLDDEDVVLEEDEMDSPWDIPWD